MGGGLVPFMTMVVVQVCFAGMNILSKLAMDSGMNPFVFVAYRQIFASIAITPFAYFFERKTRPRMTQSILFQIFCSSIFGVTMNQITYFVGLKNSTPTIGCALTNLLPAFTFLLAVPFGQESVGIKSKAGQAKLVGTIVCVGGAMVLSFYHGPIIPIGGSSIHWKYAENVSNRSNHSNHGNFILGPLLLIASPICWAVWFIIQAKMGNKYPAPYSSTALICLMSSVQCALIGLGFNHKLSAWSLSPAIRPVSSVYAGIVCSALGFGLMSWCIERKGPLYVSVFNPLLLVIVAVLSWALLREKLYLGSVVGSILIVMGLYSVLWGKNKDMRPMNNTKEAEEEKNGTKNGNSFLESQLSDFENGNNLHATS